MSDDTPISAPSPSHDVGRPASGSSPWMGWTLALLAVPVVYVLTFPPILLTVFTRGGLPLVLNPPPWMRVYMGPYEWLAQRTPLHEPLKNYGIWWSTRFGCYTPTAPAPTPPPTAAP